ncbi:hypothetical protein BGX38DRAFT_1270622 [Terfezia claveryi]|nr:hypothetical protein BGX38DRAFT_1270622 [Terfezia claveryi]
MLFEEGDAALLLQNWIVKRLEDMYVPQSTVSSYTRSYVHDVFAALRSKTFLIVNSTLSGGGVQSTPPTPVTSTRQQQLQPLESQQSKQEDMDGSRRGGDRSGANFGRWTRGGAAMGAATSVLGVLAAVPGFPAGTPWPEDPMAALPAMQAWTGIAGFPPIPPPGAPVPKDAAVPSAGAGAQRKPVERKIGERCRDYDEKGGGPKLATVKFEQWENAKRAYDSPAPIFEDMFVKVFWYKSSVDGGRKPTTVAEQVGSRWIWRSLSGKRRRHKKRMKKMRKKREHEEIKRKLEKKEELLNMEMEQRRVLMEKL